MQFFSSSQFPWPDAKLPLGVAALAAGGRGGADRKSVV